MHTIGKAPMHKPLIVITTPMSNANAESRLPTTAVRTRLIMAMPVSTIKASTPLSIIWNVLMVVSVSYGTYEACDGLPQSLQTH